MIRYFRPDSSECSRRISVAHSTYSGIDSSSKPTNSVDRVLRRDEHDHAARSRSAAARSTRRARPRAAPPSATTAAPWRCRAATKISVSTSVRSSMRSAPDTIEALRVPLPDAQPDRRAERDERERPARRRARTKRARSSPTSSTSSAPPSSASSGESAAQSMCGPLMRGAAIIGLAATCRHRRAVRPPSSAPALSANCG